jgi:hypothetical protein
MNGRVVRLLVAAAFTLAVPSLVSAQTLSGISSVGLSANLPQSLSISITSGAAVNFALAPNAAADGDVPVVVRSTWNLNPGQTGAVSLYGYFDVPASALNDGTDDIPTSWVEGRMTTGTPTSYTAFAQTNPVGPAGGSLALFTEAIAAATRSRPATTI